MRSAADCHIFNWAISGARFGEIAENAPTTTPIEPKLAQEAGWLEWQAQSGRGKRGQLRFLVTPESLRNAMMEQALETGKQQDVLELAQLAPGELREL